MSFLFSDPFAFLEHKNNKDEEMGISSAGQLILVNFVGSEHIWENKKLGPVE